MFWKLLPEFLCLGFIVIAYCAILTQINKSSKLKSEYPFITASITNIFMFGMIYWLGFFEGAWTSFKIVYLISTIIIAISVYVSAYEIKTIHNYLSEIIKNVSTSIVYLFLAYKCNLYDHTVQLIKNIL